MLERILNVAAVACAVAVTTLLVRREFSSGAASTAVDSRQDDRVLSEWSRLIEGGGTIGASTAPVTILEFGDYQCPGCRMFQRSLDAVISEFPGEVRLVYRHLPLEDIHPVAYLAAKASRCAGEQGQFESMHKLLYSEAAAIGRRAMSAFAADAGVQDTALFRTCLSRSDRVAEIDADISLARELGLRGTPSVAINGVLYGAPPDSARLSKLVREHLRQARENASR